MFTSRERARLSDMLVQN